MSITSRKYITDLKNSKLASVEESSANFKRKRAEKIHSQKNVSRPVIPGIPQFQELQCGQSIKISIGTFKIVEELAIGRCCEVYAGKEQSSNLNKAVKVFRRQQYYKGALDREIKFINLLTPHKYIVASYGFYQFEGRDILIHELLSKTLKDIFVILVSGKRLPSEWLIITLAKHLMRGLSHLFRLGVIHGDLKPQNIMWCGEDECFKLIDFGVSFSTSENLKHAIQSRAYQAPETVVWNKWLQRNSHGACDAIKCIPPGCASDIWSAGCIISELMCGSKVFQLGWDGEDVNESLNKSLSLITKSYSTDFFANATKWFQRSLDVNCENRAPADELLKDVFLNGPLPAPSIFDLLLLPTKVLRLMKAIRSDIKTCKSEILKKILETVSSCQPHEHKVDESCGSIYLLFDSIDKSTKALKCLRNTCVMSLHRQLLPKCTPVTRQSPLTILLHCTLSFLLRYPFFKREKEILKKILETVSSCQPHEHKVDESCGSIYLLFDSIDKSTKALKCLRNTCVKGYTIIPTFFPLEKWISQ